MVINGKKIKIVVIIVLLLSILAILSSCFIKNVRQVYAEASHSQVESYIFDSINKTTDKIVVSNKNKTLVSLTKDEKGLVSSISINVEQVNILSNEVAVKCQEDLKTSKQSLILHLGAFTGSRLFANRGRTVYVPMDVNYTVKSDFRPFAEKVGINVVRYALYLEITTIADIVLPINEENAEFVTYILVNEMVFSIEVPDTFISSEDGLDYLDLIPN